MDLIVWDVDDVLNNLTELWLSDWHQNNGSETPAYSELTHNPPHEQLGVQFSEYLASLDKIRGSIPEHDRLTPNPHVLDWLRKEGHRYRHMALTARPAHCLAGSAAWVMTHFGEWIRTFAFVPVRKPEAWPIYSATKADYLKTLTCPCLLIDDSLQNVAEAKRAGFETLLFPQPWNGGQRPVLELITNLLKG